MLRDQKGKKGQTSWHPSAGELDRLLQKFLADHPAPIVTDEEYERRLAACRSCSNLQHGTTCRFCGCLVAVVAKVADQHCGNPEKPKW